MLNQERKETLMHPRQYVAVAALALGLAATVLAGPSTALAAKKSPGDDKPLPTNVERGIPQAMAKVDLMAGFYPSTTQLDPSQELEVPVVVANVGNATANNVRVDVIVALPFQNVQVVDAAGFTCSMTTHTSGPVTGHWITCTGGQVNPAPGAVIMKVGAKAPQTPGNYKMIAEADLHNTIVELNGEGNNSDDVTFFVH
jgi:hypothetical protein